MTAQQTVALDPSMGAWPQSLIARLGQAAPPLLMALGPLELLAGKRVAIFCSARTPGESILRTHDAARALRDEGVQVVSGFHSELERECLEILLRGKQPIIICPGRAIESMRVPPALRLAFDAGRILFLSPFIQEPQRVTRASALRRNEVVAALADEAYIAHTEKGGITELIAKRLREWGVPII